MENVYRTIRKSIRNDARDILIQPVAGEHQAMAYIDITVRRPVTVMSIREYFVDQIFSVCVRTGTNTMVPIRLQVRRIDPMGHTFRLFLKLAEEWADEDKQLLDGLFIFTGTEASKEGEEDVWNIGSMLWPMYVIGICIHSPEMPACLFGDEEHYVYFPNEGYVPYTGKLAGEDFELVANLVPEESLRAVQNITRGLEEHTNSLGEVAEVSAITSIASVTSEADGDIESDIAKLLEAADDAFSDPSPRMQNTCVSV